MMACTPALCRWTIPAFIPEAADYASRSSTLSETKTIGPLDRNDMSYVPATTVKNGVTLNLANVDWQVIGTDLVGDVLAPSSYQAGGYLHWEILLQRGDRVHHHSGICRRGHSRWGGSEKSTYELTYLGTGSPCWGRE